MAFDWIAAGWKAAVTVARSFWKLTRQLFHEMTGALFALFAFSGALSAWRQWMHGRVVWLTALTIAYSLMMAAFSVTSFRSAGRVR